MSPRMYEDKNDALDFPTHLDWLNTEKPLTMQDFLAESSFWISGPTAELTVCTCFRSCENWNRNIRTR
jgi:hypothetical protein